MAIEVLCKTKKSFALVFPVWFTRRSPMVLKNFNKVNKLNVQLCRYNTLK